jgi:pathogenesis-related protein 1
MRRPILRLAAAWMAAYSVTSAAVADDVIFIASFATEPPAVLDITSAHNVVRAAVGVGPFFWDEQLAATAQAWADTCTDSDNNGFLDHNPNRSVGYPWYVGENIAASSGAITAQIAVDLWASEQQYYDYLTNTCAPGQTCGHYTQIVWANSILLGCGMSSCPQLTLPNSIVCNYGPGGNIIGLWPY